MIHVLLGGREYWLRGRVTLDQFLKEQEAKAGGELAVDESGPTIAASNRNDEEPHVHVTELHEVRTINSGVGELNKMGFDIQAPIPQERTGIRSRGMCCVAAIPPYHSRTCAVSCRRSATPAKKGCT